MKKILSVFMAMIMVLSTMVMLVPVASAETASTPVTIYAEDFTDLADGTYTLLGLAKALRWGLLRGDADAEIATVADGRLTIDATESDTDVVFQVASDSGLSFNHTLQYDMTKTYKPGNMYFAGMYTGTDDGKTVKAIINKTTYENYNLMALADGVINETNQRAAGYKIGGGSYDQCRPENIPGGGDSNTWKVVYDVTNNQVDAYAAGTRINSTIGSIDTADDWDAVNVADYVGEGAYIRVQKTGSATFDNISIVTGGDAVSYGDYAYAQDFSGIPDGTYTGAEMAALTGFQTMLDSTSKATMVYKIANGRLEIVANGECTNSYTFKNNQQFATLYVPEMEAAQDAVVIEYDMTYLYDENVEGSANSGDTPLGIEMYGRRADFHAFWQFTPKGFPMYGFYKGTHTVDGTKYSLTQAGSTADKLYYYQSQGRWEDTNFNSKAGTYGFSNGSYGNSLTGSTEHIKVVLSITDGMFIFVNGVCAIQLSETALAAWTSTLGGGDASHIIGNLLRFRVPAGCHVALDNIKITTDPAPIAGPDLWLTEASCGVTVEGFSGFSGAEYVEVYNASNKAINIYDYALTQRAYSNSLDNIGTAIALIDITLMYPGTHTFKSIKVDETTGAPLYTYDITNPAYEEGWLQPGEVCVLWNKTDSMHNGAYSNPSVITDSTKPNYGMGNFGHDTVNEFRTKIVGLPETTKVFQMYNDYNRAFNNSGSHFVALVDRDLVQPGYDPAIGTGDETLIDALIGFADYASTILDVTADANSGRTVKTVTYASYDVTEAYGYSSVVFGRPDSALTPSGMTPGTVKSTQKICTWSGVITTEPTCTEEGVMEYTCEHCGDTKTEAAPALGHDWKTGVTSEFSCTEDSVTVYTCSRCGETKTETTPAPGHAWDEGMKTGEPSCSAGYQIQYTCTVCFQSRVETVEPLDHTWSQGAATTEPTCTEEGVLTYTCTGCGATKTEVIPALGHTWGNWTEFNDEQHKRICSNGLCEETADHVWDEGMVVMPAYCDRDGILSYSCVECGKTKTEVIPAPGHTFGGNAVITTEPTCDTDGVRTYTCTGCGTTMTEVIPALGHAFGDWTPVDGELHKSVCANCKDEKTEAHTWSDHTCTECGMEQKIDHSTAVMTVESKTVRVDETVTLNVNLGENPGIAGVILTLTYDTENLELISVENGSIFATMTNGINVVLNQTSGNATANGTALVLTFKTSVAGEYEIGMIIREAANADLETVEIEAISGTLTVLDFVFGDVDGNGLVNLRDSILLNQYLANYDYNTGTSSVAVQPGADANYDGTVNLRDIILLNQYLANYDYDTGSSSVVLGPVK